MCLFSLNRLWVFLCFWGTLVYLSPEATTGSVFNSVHGISNLASAFVLLACGLTSQPVDRLLASRFGALVPAAIASIGTIALALSPAPETETSISGLALFGSIATGCGSGIVLLDIARQYVNEKARTIALETTVAFAIAAVAYGAVSLCGSGPAIALACAIPLVIAVSIRVHERHGIDDRRKLSSKAGDSPDGIVARLARSKNALGSTAKPLLKLITGIVLFSIPVEFMRGIYTQTQFETFSSTFALFLPIVVCGICLIVATYCVAAKEFRLGVFFKLMIPITICGFLVAPLFNQAGSLGLAMTSSGYCLFQILTWVLFASLSTRLSLSPVSVFGLGNGLMRSVGILIGASITFISTRQELEGDSLVTVSLFAIALLAMAFLVAFTEKDLEQLGIGLGCEQADANESLRRKVPLQRRCEIIGRHYGLSPRECEIFRLLSIGRNAKAISEELHIARGTMNTHMRNIYRKLDVHSQQALIDLMQNADLDTLAQEQEMAKGNR